MQKTRETYYPDTPIQELFLRHREETPLSVIEMEGFPKSYFEKLVNENTGN